MNEHQTRRFFQVVWAILLFQAVFFLLRYPPNMPVEDEWEFVPVLLGEEPFVPWLWKFHNEHRFPLPRLFYVPLYQLTGDFRGGIWFSLMGITGAAWYLMRLARQIRGRADVADAFFPMSLLNIGHHENWFMGYQIVFMFTVFLVSLLLGLLITTSAQNYIRRGFQVGGVAILLALCGAAGLAFGPPMMAWLVALIWFHRSSAEPVQSNRTWLLLIPFALIGLVIWLYFRGYARPQWHPPSAGIWPSFLIAMQSLSMAFGDSMRVLWPATLPALVLFVMFALGQLLYQFKKAPEDRVRVVGLLFYGGAILILAAGIGWGRSGFPDPEMGLATRYSWITWPFLASCFMSWLISGTPWLATWGPRALAGALLLLLPFHMANGIQMAEHRRAYFVSIEENIAEGYTIPKVIDEHFDGYPDYMQEHIARALGRLHDHKIGIFSKLTIPAESPQKPPEKSP